MLMAGGQLKAPAEIEGLADQYPGLPEALERIVAATLHKRSQALLRLGKT